MAKLLDHAHRSATRGAPVPLTELMISAAMSTPHARRLTGAGRERYARAHVVAAVRRAASTDMRQELLMSEAERMEWEAFFSVHA